MKWVSRSAKILFWGLVALSLLVCYSATRLQRRFGHSINEQDTQSMVVERLGEPERTIEATQELVWTDRYLLIWWEERVVFGNDGLPLSITRLKHVGVPWLHMTSTEYEHTRGCP
ncbi:MAG: hypothetical protein D6E12_07580 [Desulfovibrio sp.]|nr:MAG: hypothetical protein D6E12_07580 [Desulfovibrio sp.]